MSDHFGKLCIIELTLPDAIPDGERKLTELFIFSLLCVVSKGFMKAFKAFIKPFDATQRSLKINLIFVLIQLSEMHRAGRVNF